MRGLALVVLLAWASPAHATYCATSSPGAARYDVYEISRPACFAGDSTISERVYDIYKSQRTCLPYTGRQDERPVTGMACLQPDGRWKLLSAVPAEQRPEDRLEHLVRRLRPALRDAGIGYYGLGREDGNRVVFALADKDRVAAASRIIIALDDHVGMHADRYGRFTLWYGANPLIDASRAPVVIDRGPAPEAASSERVRFVQGQLVSLGYEVPQHGVLDEATRRSIIAFERRVGLQPDGALTIELYEKLQAEYKYCVVARSVAQDPAPIERRCREAQNR